MGTDDHDLSEAEREALHAMQSGIEHVYRGYGELLAFHHRVGHAMGKFDDAEAALREAGHGEYADTLRDRHLPAGAVGDDWTYELVEAFRADMLAAIAEFEASVRADLAGGEGHVTERAQQRRWRERARGWDDED
jgi:hypothetical protein